MLAPVNVCFWAWAGGRGLQRASLGQGRVHPVLILQARALDSRGRRGGGSRREPGRAAALTQAPRGLGACRPIAQGAGPTLQEGAAADGGAGRGVVGGSSGGGRESPAGARPMWTRGPSQRPTPGEGGPGAHGGAGGRPRGRAGPRRHTPPGRSARGDPPHCRAGLTQSGARGRQEGTDAAGRVWPSPRTQLGRGQLDGRGPRRPLPGGRGGGARRRRVD